MTWWKRGLCFVGAACALALTGWAVPPLGRLSALVMGAALLLVLGWAVAFPWLGMACIAWERFLILCRWSRRSPVLLDRSICIDRPDASELEAELVGVERAYERGEPHAAVSASAYDRVYACLRARAPVKRHGYWPQRIDFTGAGPTWADFFFYYGPV